MAADRWYYLRHPEGFRPDLFDSVRSGWLLWKADVEASIRHWRHMDLRGIPQPEYEWYEPELSDDAKLITIPVGGQGTYGSFKVFEETVPDFFHRYLPYWFRIDLETGRRDSAGWFTDTTWGWIVAPEDREGHRKIFPRPTEGLRGD